MLRSSFGFYLLLFIIKFTAMNSISVVLLCSFLTLFPMLARANQVEMIESPQLQVERFEGRVTVRFPTVSGTKYQLFRSADLIDWEPIAHVIVGTDAPVEVNQDVAEGELAFFRVEARSVSLPVPLEFDFAVPGGLGVTFPSAAGQSYLVYSSTDLRNWFLLSDFILGTGAPITVDTSTLTDPIAFFGVETVDLVPLPNMVRINAGKFLMGSPLDEKDRDLDEDPLTEVIFPNGFWMGKYEVTQREYESLMGINPSWFKGDPRRPVDQVSWQEAVFFCAILTERERAAGRLSGSLAYRLPTEAEFEYASRAGTTSRFSHGDDLTYELLDQFAWYDDNGGSTSHPVGEKRPNPFGLFDMHGNVWEWCLDWYSSVYAGGTVTAPVGPDSGRARIFRGGGWDWSASKCRSAFRNNVTPTRRLKFLGFRLVLAPNLPLPGI